MEGQLCLIFNKNAVSIQLKFTGNLRFFEVYIFWSRDLSRVFEESFMLFHAFLWKIWSINHFFHPEFEPRPYTVSVRGNYDSHVCCHKMKLVWWLVYFNDKHSVVGNLLLLVLPRMRKRWTTTQMTRVSWNRYFQLRGKGYLFCWNLEFNKKKKEWYWMLLFSLLAKKNIMSKSTCELILICDRFMRQEANCQS